MDKKITLGYHGLNHTLRKQHIFADRTVRQNTLEQLKGKKIVYLKELCKRNVEDLYKIMLWNVENKIHFYRLTSGLAPHITNPVFIPKKYHHDYRALVYSLEYLRPVFKKIGDLAKKYDIRITFHPGQHVSLSSSNEEIIIKSYRDLYWHAKILDMMGLDYNSIIIVHGGGTYGDKPSAMKVFIKNFKRMPAALRRRIALENDEKNYSVEDVLKISSIVQVPIVFDIFHYQLYHQTIVRKRNLGENIPNQPKLEEIFPKVIRSWGNRRVKMHISEQRKDSVFGAHSDYVRVIPDVLLLFPHRYNRNLDLMVEAKYNEIALLYLRKKYKNKVR